MKVVNHPNVVRMYEVLASRTKIFIVLELVSGGELFDKIVSKKRFDEALARFYFRQLIRGVKYCHSIGVFHRDLKVRARAPEAPLGSTCPSLTPLHLLPSPPPTPLAREPAAGRRGEPQDL